LHHNNVLLYEPVKGKYIEYHYHKSGVLTGEPPTVVSFKSKYIAKIIDYGRCFFDDKVETPGFIGSSGGIYTEACSFDKCINCGKNQGFHFLEHNPAKLASNFFICSQIQNISHDLRLLYMVKFAIRQQIQNVSALKPALGQLYDLIEKVEYGKGITLDEKLKKLAKNPLQWVYLGTKENTKYGLPNKINNIIDANKELERSVLSPWYQVKNDANYASQTKLGDLHVYDNGRPMRYDPM
jgi:hypothetical protein